MKKTGKILSIGIIVLILTSFISLSPLVLSDSTVISPTDSIPDSIDLTKYFHEINDDKKAKIPVQFKQGHVSIADLKTGFKKTEFGYEIQLSNTNVPSPAVYKGKVFVSGGFGSKQYYAFDAKTGKKIWSVNLDDDGPSSAAIVDDIIVFNTESCTIFACKTETGEQIWSYWLGDPLMSMPTIANGIVFTAYPASYGMNNTNIKTQQQNIISNNTQLINENINASHVLIAIELRTGKILWQKRIDGDVMSAPVAIKDELYVSTFAGTLFKLKQKTGEILSAKSIRATSAPVVYKGQIFMSQRSDIKGEKVTESIVNYDAVDINRTRIFNKKAAPYLDKNIQQQSNLKKNAVSEDAGNGFAGGAPISSGWVAANENIGQSNVSSLQSFQGSRTLYHNGYNYNTMGNELICTNVKSAKQTWKIKLDGDMQKEGGFMGTPPLYAGSKIVLASINGDIIILDPKKGKQIKKYKIKENIRYQPVVENGWVYVTTTSGKMLAINTGDKTLSGWPMWGANPARTNLVK